MTKIVAGNFANRAQADSAIEALRNGGVAAVRINSTPHDDGAFGGMAEGTAEQAETTTPGWYPNQVNVAVDASIATDRAYVAGILRNRGATEVTEIERI